MDDSFFTISKTQAEKLRSYSQPLIFKKQTQLIYQGHVPISAYLLTDGFVYLKKNKKVIKKYFPLTVFGIRELVTKTPFSFDVIVSKGCILLYLDRSRAFQMMSELESEKDLLLRRIFTI